MKSTLRASLRIWCYSLGFIALIAAAVFPILLMPSWGFKALQIFVAAVPRLRGNLELLLGTGTIWGRFSVGLTVLMGTVGLLTSGPTAPMHARCGVAFVCATFTILALLYGPLVFLLLILIAAAGVADNFWDRAIMLGKTIPWWLAGCGYWIAAVTLCSWIKLQTMSPWLYWSPVGVVLAVRGVDTLTKLCERLIPPLPL